ncbi:MAG: TetR/AcrR family transcriptional regulator [Proteobacteria bacterium]|nr:TetR/AcrR family transcriptional regulator [Pseudomonadota bacterium]
MHKTPSPARPKKPGSPSRPAGTQTSERILDEAERLIATRGVFGFALRDIADPLRVRVPAIYKHYESRDDVLVAVARRFVALLSKQFSYDLAALSHPTQTLQTVIEEFARFHLTHPAYVRLSLIDFATPDGGSEYIRLAAGGPFRSNLNAGPLAPMHRRLRQLLAAGAKAGVFREISEVDFYRLIKSVLLVRLVFPDDLLGTKPVSAADRRKVERMLWETALRHVTTSL